MFILSENRNLHKDEILNQIENGFLRDKDAVKELLELRKVLIDKIIEGDKSVSNASVIALDFSLRFIEYEMTNLVEHLMYPYEIQDLDKCEYSQSVTECIEIANLIRNK